MSSDLNHLKNIAKELNLIPVNKPTMVIGGTNGKGSCVAIASHILQAAGYNVGAFTSPHLFHYNERIQCNGVPVTDAEINEAFACLKNFSLNYFEQATLAALYIFKQKSLDVLLFEVGLGGRLDPVNIIDSDVAVISTVSLDHQEILGNTREQIGWEKAHIFRANKPAVCGDYHTPNSVKAYAKEIHANLYCCGENFAFDEKTWNFPQPTLPLQNAVTIVQALSLFPLPIDQQAIEQGLRQATLPGRFQIIEKPFLQIFDVAHNPASAALLAKNLNAQKVTGKTFAVVGMLADKDIEQTLKPMLPLVDQWYVGEVDSPRTASVEQLADTIKKYMPKVTMAKKIEQAYAQAMQEATSDDRIVVFGSFYTVGQLWTKNFSIS